MTAVQVGIKGVPACSVSVMAGKKALPLSIDSEVSLLWIYRSLCFLLS